MKMQVAFRDNGHIQNGYRMAILAGLVEFPLHQPPEGMIGSFVMDMSLDDGRAGPACVIPLSQYRPPRDGDGNAPWPGTDVPGMVTQRVWQAPQCLGFCEMFFRRTLVEPSKPGLVVMAASGLMAVYRGVEIDQNSVFELTWERDRFSFDGRVGEDLRPDWGQPHLIEMTRGYSNSEFLRIPVWGFGPEPVCVPWQGDLETAAVFDEFRGLGIRDDMSAEESERFAGLRRRLVPEGLDNLSREPTFKAALQKLAERGLLLPSAAPMTRHQTEEMDRFMAEIVKEIHDREQAASPGF